jgi:hypothetical protein
MHYITKHDSLKRRRAEQTDVWLNGFKADIMNQEEQGFRILEAGIPDGRTIKEGDMTLKLAIQMLEDLGAIQKVTIIPVVVRIPHRETFVVEMNTLDSSVWFLRNRIAEMCVHFSEESLLFVVGENIFSDHEQLLDGRTIEGPCNAMVFENTRSCLFYTISECCVAASI